MGPNIEFSYSALQLKNIFCFDVQQFASARRIIPRELNAFFWIKAADRTFLRYIYDIQFFAVFFELNDQ